MWYLIQVLKNIFVISECLFFFLSVYECLIYLFYYENKRAAQQQQWLLLQMAIAIKADRPATTKEISVISKLLAALCISFFIICNFFFFCLCLCFCGLEIDVVVAVFCWFYFAFARSVGRLRHISVFLGRKC